MSLFALLTGTLLAADHACAVVLAGVVAVAALSGSGGEAARQETGAWGARAGPGLRFPLLTTSRDRWLPNFPLDSANFLQ